MLYQLAKLRQIKAFQMGVNISPVNFLNNM